MAESPRFQTADAAFADRVRDSFERQTAMSSLGAQIVRVEAGEVELGMPYHPAYCQQHGFLHAGTVTTVLDSACGYAAYSLMPADAAVLSIEFKINLLSPAKGEHFRFVGRVVKAGRTITNVRGEAFGREGGKEKLVATMDGTMMTLRERTGLAG